MDAELQNDPNYLAIRLPREEFISTMIACIQRPWTGSQAIFLGPQESVALPTVTSVQRSSKLTLTRDPITSRWGIKRR